MLSMAVDKDSFIYCDNSISRLNLIVQKTCPGAQPVYVDVKQEGGVNGIRPFFTIECSVGTSKARGKGPNKKTAKRNAAAALLKALGYRLRPQQETSCDQIDPEDDKSIETRIDKLIKASAAKSLKHFMPGAASDMEESSDEQDDPKSYKKSFQSDLVFKEPSDSEGSDSDHVGSQSSSNCLSRHYRREDIRSKTFYNDNGIYTVKKSTISHVYRERRYRQRRDDSYLDESDSDSSRRIARVREKKRQRSESEGELEDNDKKCKKNCRNKKRKPKHHHHHHHHHCHNHHRHHHHRNHEHLKSGFRKAESLKRYKQEIQIKSTRTLSSQSKSCSEESLPSAEDRQPSVALDHLLEGQDKQAIKGADSPSEEEKEITLEFSNSNNSSPGHHENAVIPSSDSRTELKDDSSSYLLPEEMASKMDLQDLKMLKESLEKKIGLHGKDKHTASDKYLERKTVKLLNSKKEGFDKKNSDLYNLAITNIDLKPSSHRHLNRRCLKDVNARKNLQCNTSLLNQKTRGQVSVNNSAPHSGSVIPVVISRYASASVTVKKQVNQQVISDKVQPQKFTGKPDKPIPVLISSSRQENASLVSSAQLEQVPVVSDSQQRQISVVSNTGQDQVSREISVTTSSVTNCSFSSYQQERRISIFSGKQVRNDEVNCDVLVQDDPAKMLQYFGENASSGNNESLNASLSQKMEREVFTRISQENEKPLSELLKEKHRLQQNLEFLERELNIAQGLHDQIMEKTSNFQFWDHYYIENQGIIQEIQEKCEETLEYLKICKTKIESHSENRRKSVLKNQLALKESIDLKMLNDDDDDQKYWCKQCMTRYPLPKEWLSHLHQADHQNATSSDDKPWHKINTCEEKRERSKVFAELLQLKDPFRVQKIKGSSFIVSLPNPYYCSLCEIFTGDLELSLHHLEGEEHNENVQKKVEKYPFLDRIEKIEIDTLKKVDKKHVERKKLSEFYQEFYDHQFQMRLEYLKYAYNNEAQTLS